MPMLVKDVMTTPVIFVDYETTIDEVARVMSKNRISSVLIKKDDKAVGIITDSDIIKKVVAKNLLPSKIKVGEIMSYPLIYVKPDDEVSVATYKMKKFNIRRIVVIENGMVVGIVTATDIARLVPEMIDILELKKEMGEYPESTPIIEEEPYFGVCEECGNESNDLRFVDGKWVCESCRENL